MQVNAVLADLPALLRNRSRWPQRFCWNYRSNDGCVCALLGKIQGRQYFYFSDGAELLGLPTQMAVERIFCNRKLPRGWSYIQPEDVAKEVERLILELDPPPKVELTSWQRVVRFFRRQAK